MKKNLKFDAEFASEVMKEIPPGYIDKTVCGCGLTSVALENDVKTVIAVPTIYLAINKAEQYPNERFNGKVLAVWGETEWTDIEFYRWNNNPQKIIVTYDSLPNVIYLLDDYNYKLIIDESNELLSKTHLKPDVIDRVFSIAEEYKDTVSFISATPTPLEYMPRWISEIDQIRIEWEKTVKAQPILVERSNPYQSLRKEFISPIVQNGILTIKGKTFSKLIIFMNSVRQIANIIKETGLNKEECGIICGASLKNDSKINGIKRYVSGVMPKFLFITSSGFSGIDLYDNEAMTVVVSNTKRNWQMIDMLTDLKQAISRQRNRDNPNYGRFIYIYNQSMFSKSEEQLLSSLDAIRNRILSSINLYEYGLQSGNADGFATYPDFISYTVFKNGRYELNEQAFLADKYFILETRRQYQKGFDIRGQFENSTEVQPIVLPGEVTYSELVKYFKENNKDGEIDWGVYSTKNEWISVIETSYKCYKNVWKDYTYAKMMISNFGDVYNTIKSVANNIFSEGKYSRKEATKKMQNIYDDLKFSRSVRHHDFNEIFKEVKHSKIRGERYVEIVEK